MWLQDPNGFSDEKAESRLYVGNLDLRITEATLIKMFSPYGKIISEDFLWHTRGPRRGEPRGFAFIQFSSKETQNFLIPTVKVSMQEAKLAKEKMHGRLACGRPLVVRISSDRSLEEAAAQSSSRTAASAPRKPGLPSQPTGQTNKSAKIAAIKNKLRALEEETTSVKKQKLAIDSITSK
ncbi:unnamed protein product [Linum tenue]|uniref:RRM domain-containing protein n=1 Tax=Linum tenue TaxID=586396 RepID=A0AAV0QR21_9ROSI|nr:unnamed protein product [Linum tenue]